MDGLNRLGAGPEDRTGDFSLAAGPFRRHGDRLLHHHRLAGDIDAHLAYFADDLAHLVGEAVVGLGQGA